MLGNPIVNPNPGVAFPIPFSSHPFPVNQNSQSYGYGVESVHFGDQTMNFRGYMNVPV